MIGAGKAGTTALWYKPIFDLIWFRLLRMNTFYAPRPPIRDAFRTEMVKYFRPDVVQLQELTGRDLTHWHQ